MSLYAFPAALMAMAMTGGLAQAAADSSDAAKVPAGHYEVDPSHTSVAARINHMDFTMTTVRFLKLSGSFTYDPAQPQLSKLDVAIDAASLTSDWDARDKELRSPAFFNISTYPTIRYVATSLDKIDASHARVNGQLTLLGVTKAVAMNVTLNGGGKGMMGDQRAGFSGTLTINRSDFGMKTFLPAIGDAVDISVDAEFTRK
jgi:polyisoprenoid-binding protein YceI